MNETEQTLKEIFKKPPSKARKVYSHYQIDIPNDTHQADILFLSYDDTGSSKRYKYKYALTLVDVASRYKASRPLRNKTGDDVLEALLDIYLHDEYLKTPRVLNTDSGSEFKNKYFKDWAQRNNVYLKYNLPSFHLAFVENMNLQLAKKLYYIQSGKEIQSGKINREWVDNLPKIIKDMNNTRTRMINMKPIDAIKLKTVPQPKNNFSNTDIKLEYPKGTRVRRLLNIDEVLTLDDNKIKVGKRRATDANYSLDVYTVVYTEKHCEKCLTYHKIKNERTEELMNPMFTYYELLKTDA